VFITGVHIQALTISPALQALQENIKSKNTVNANRIARLVQAMLFSEILA